MARETILKRKDTLLFLLCWIAYFSTYIGRQNYTAVMAEIIRSEGYLNQTCGLVGTGFFLCYGSGQILSGYLGDRWNPCYMIFGGISISAAVNFLMGVLTSPEAMIAAWCVNGFAQSMTWSPLLRIFSEYLPADRQKAACVNIATTYPAAVFLTYPLCSLAVWINGWRLVFFVSGLFMALVAVLWLAGFRKLEPYFAEQKGAFSGMVRLDSLHSAEGFRFTRPLIVLLCCLGFLLTLQGALRDGVTGWVPSYLSNTYSVGTFIAIFATSFLPFINLFGVYTANLIYRKEKKDELETTAILFLISFCAMCCLVLTEGVHLLLSLLFFSVTTSCMMGINVMLVSFVPTYFIRWGKVSTVSGVLNSTVYIGSSIATYGLGAVADVWGWPWLIRLLCIVTLAGLVGSGLVIPRWKRFLMKTEKYVGYSRKK